MKTLLLVLLCAFPATIVRAEDKPKGDLAKLQGSWDGALRGGTRHMFVTVDGDAARFVYMLPGGRLSESRAKIKLDEKASPKSIDFKLRDNIPERGIYKLSGDTWTLCLGGVDGERPMYFTDEAGGRSTLVKLKRRKVTEQERKKDKAS